MKRLISSLVILIFSITLVMAVTKPGTLVFRYSIGSGISSSMTLETIGNDSHLCFGAWNGNFYDVNLTSGTVGYWELSSPIHTSPATGLMGTVYVGTSDGDLYAINLNSGQEEWNYSTYSGINSAISVDNDGTIYFGTDDGNIYAINPDGTLNWKQSVSDDAIESGPTLGANGRIYFGSKGMLLVSDENGNVLNSMFFSDDHLTNPAIGHYGTVYVGASDGNLYALSEGFQNVKWKFQTNGPINSNPTIGPDGTIYFGSDDGNLYAISRDGTFKWNYEIGSPVRSSPTVGQDGVIYVGANNGTFYAISQNGTLEWKYKTDGIITAHPLIYNGDVYFGSYDGYIYCLTCSSQSVATTSW